ncbi:S4 domain-containing protein YaaA [Mycobacterium tuberculosis]|uniref:S4 domain-containing protein YaaA n=1 Tax=Mycobacterium tuberculosis TaxID=1773 RepID=UPI000D30C3C8
MNYKLFDEFITLQALFKELGIIQSGGAIKAFLHENQVEVNGEVETRRGRKLRVGDTSEVIGEKEVITLTEPSPEEIEDYQADKLEKERVAQLVKKLNKEQKQKKDSKPKKEENKRKPVRFPGT